MDLILVNARAGPWSTLLAEKVEVRASAGGFTHSNHFSILLSVLTIHNKKHCMRLCRQPAAQRLPRLEKSLFQSDIQLSSQLDISSVDANSVAAECSECASRTR